MLGKFKIGALALLVLAVSGARADNPVHPILQTLSKNLTISARGTYSFALTTLNPLYPGTTNVINALAQFTREAQQFQNLMNDPAVQDAAIQGEVANLALGSQQVAFAINALGLQPSLNNLVLRWNQTVNILNQIKAFVPPAAGRELARARAFEALHGRP